MESFQNKDIPTCKIKYTKLVLSSTLVRVFIINVIYAVQFIYFSSINRQRHENLCADRLHEDGQRSC